MEVFNAVTTDLRRALRSVLRDPMHSFGIISILVLGIGANAAAFGMVKSVLLDPLPFDDPEQLVLAWPDVRHTPAGVEELRALAGFTRGAGFRGRDLTLLDVGFPKPVEGAVVWSNYLALLGSEPVLGRGFLPEDQEPGAAVVILSHDFWVTYLGGDRDVVGREITLDGYGGRSRTVIGVMGADFRSLLPGREVWLPAILDPTDEAYQSSGTYRILARLSPGVDAVQAEQQVAAVARRWQSAAPDRWSDESIRSARVVPLTEDIIGEARSGLLLAFVSVLVLLLIACAGISNLVLSKAVVRRRERWIMAALGASRARILRRQVLETVILGTTGAVVGLVVAQWSLNLVLPFLPADFPRINDLRLDGVVLVFGLVLSNAVAVVASLIPLLHRGSEDGTGGLTRGVSDTRTTVRARSAIVSAQIALALPLSLAAGLLLTSVFELRRVDPGFEASGLLTLSSTPTLDRYEEPASRITLVGALAERLGALPHVTSVGAIQTLPLMGSNWETPYVAEDHPVPEGQSTPVASLRVITPGYLEAMRIGLVAGRPPSVADHAEAQPVGWINRALADHLWPGESALGKSIRFYWEGGPEFIVSGVLDNVRHSDLRSDVAFEIYRPYAQWMSPTSMRWVLRTDGDPGALTASAAAAIREVDPSILLTEVRLMTDIVESTLAHPVLLSRLLAGMGVIGAGLALIGVFAVNAYSARRRTAEFSLKIALGAGRGAILRDAMSGAVQPILGGVILGLGGAFLSTRVLSSYLYGVSALNPGVYVSVTGAICAVAFLAVLIPARRAIGVDPAQVLKAEAQL